MKKLILALLCISYAINNCAMDINIDTQYEKTKNTINVMENIIRQRRHVSANDPGFKYVLLLIKLDKFLQIYVPSYNPYAFLNLPIDEAIMVLAAYQKNTQLMRFLVPRVQSFLNRPGVWDALTHLYFGEVPSVALMVELKSMLMTA